MGPADPAVPRPDVPSSDAPTPGALAFGPRAPASSLQASTSKATPAHPLRGLLIGFAGVLAAGTIVLMLPMAPADGSWTPALTAFFTATSALTGTGLVVVDTGTHWSGVGHVVIMSLLVLGGIGIMASTGLVLVVLGRRTDLRSRLLLAGTNGSALADTRAIVLRTIRFVLLGTAIGAVLLGMLFLARGMSPPEAAWWGLFHAASAFNNAGFDLTGGFRGFTPFAGDLGIVLVTTVLMLIGSLGLLAITETWTRRRWRAISVESRLVLLVSGVLAAGGAVTILAVEWTNPATLAGMGPLERVSNALFASVSARSTGMNTVDVAAMRPETLSLTTGLMFIGGAVGSTAGGIRVNTLAVLAIVVISVLRRHAEPAALGRRLEPRTVFLAVVTAIALLTVGTGSLLVQLLVDSPDPGIRSAVGFEVVSAFGTVGLSTGLTGDLGPAGQLALAACMLVGRLSVLALAVLFSQGIRTRGGRPPRGIMREA